MTAMDQQNRNRTVWRTAAMLFAMAAGAWGQTEMSLGDAVRVALGKNPAIAAARAVSKGAESGVSEARGGFLPRVDYAESWTRSDNPVFVFSSLLTQHQFGAQNFLPGPLNRPGFLSNFQSMVSVDETVYDGGRTAQAVKAAKLVREVAGESGRLTEMDTIAAVVRTYYGALLSAEQLKAASEAVRSAEADLKLAEAVRSAGLSTDADVLSIRVHLAGVEEQRIRRAADLDVVKAALNDVLGLPLETEHLLTSPLTRVKLGEGSVSDYEVRAAVNRPEAQQAKLAVSIAENEAAKALSGLMPEVVVHGAFEADRQRFYDRGGANWLVSGGVKWNLYDGGRDRARIDQSASLVKRSEAERGRAGSAIRLEVRRAWADSRAAGQRIEVANAAVAQAEESLRITQNRYEAGMSNVTELLRTEAALLEARTRALAAIHDERIAVVALELATGDLKADSEVLN